MHDDLHDIIVITEVYICTSGLFLLHFRVGKITEKITTYLVNDLLHIITHTVK